MYSLTKSEVLSLKSGDGSAALGLACALGGAFVTFLVTLLTVPTTSAVLHAAFVACSLAAAVLALYFGIEFYRAKRKAQCELDSIFERGMGNSLSRIDRRAGA